MSYRWFITYNIIGGVLWICAFSLIGFFFGGLPDCQGEFQPARVRDHRDFAAGGCFGCPADYPVFEELMRAKNRKTPGE